MRRVVVTGLGLVTPLGVGTGATWEGLLAGKSGIGPITHFDTSKHDTKIAGTVPDWDGTRYIEKRKIKEFGRFAEFAMAAGLFAWEDSGLGQRSVEERDRIGCVVGVGMGGLEILELSAKVLMEKGPGRISPYFILGLIPNMASGHLAMRLGLRGTNYCTTSACSSGAHAIGEAFRAIQHGDFDAMVAGGAEATVTPLGMGGFNAMKALSTRNEEPTKASRPWDRNRDGFVMGEGAGILVLEEREQAMKRGAKIYCEVVGYGASDDAHHVTQPAPEGEGAQRAMRAALRDAKIDLERIGYINAHGTSTPAGDVQECLAIKGVFGAYAKKVPVSSTKSMMGHLLGAAGGVEAGIIALALAHGALPPTLNLDDPSDGCDLDFIPHTARQAKIEYAMSNAFGFGGTNTALVFARS